MRPDVAPVVRAVAGGAVMHTAAAAATGSAPIGRLLRAVDFERVLGTPSRARSPHFAVHFLPSRPSCPAFARARADAGELSTGEPVDPASAVDGSAPDAWWVGTVVPKRHARRAVTRSLLKRQIHRAVRDQLASGEPALPHGLWVVRLRAGFDRTAYPSAASDALRRAAAAELDAVVAQAARRARG